MSPTGIPRLQAWEEVKPRELRRAEAAVRAASARHEAARQARDNAVRQAIADGWTHAEIAEATGLSRGRIGQIAAE